MMKTIRNCLLMMVLLLLAFTACNQDNPIPGEAVVDATVDVTTEDLTTGYEEEDDEEEDDDDN